MGNDWSSARGQIRVLLADDQALFRRGINAVLTGEADIDVVAEADNGTDAISGAIDLAPDVVLMDVRMPGVNGIEAARSIKQSCPSTAILMLTISDEEDDLYAAIKAGASGYILKEVSVATVAAAIRSVMNGESFLSPSMASKLLLEFNVMRQREERVPGETSPLTPRETEVLRHVARGRTNQQIAVALDAPENSIRNHVRNILEKLHLQDRMEAAKYALDTQLLDSAPEETAGR